jgi:hypothetical protein
MPIDYRRLSISYLEGLAADRPLATSVVNKTFYLATDTAGGTLYRSDGVSWRQIAAGVTSGGGGGGGVASVTAASGKIVVGGTATDPNIDVGTGIPESSIVNLVADLAAKAATASLGSAAFVSVASLDSRYDAAGVAATAVASEATARAAADALLAPLASPALTGSPTINGILVAQRQIVAESHSDVTASNTAAEVAVVDLTLSGGLVASGDLIQLVAHCSLLNNSGSAVTYLSRVKFGTTTVLTTSALSVAAGGTQRQTRILTVNIIVDSTTAQRINAALMGSGYGTPGTWGAQVAGSSNIGYGTAAEDTSSSKQVQFTVQMGTAVSTAEFVAHAAVLEVVRKR